MEKFNIIIQTKMIKSIFKIALVTIFMQTTNAQTALPKGFVSLFDGTSTSGWHAYGKKTATAAWKVENGELHFDPTAAKNGQGGDLVTDKEYTNFHLKLEWKVAANANSGIIFFVQDDKTVSACIREIEVIGEATKQIPKEITDKFTDLPWSLMAKMRDKLIHWYFEVDEEIIWNVAVDKLPPIKNQIDKIIEQNKS